MHPFYIIRATGGGLFLAGALLMVINIWKTIAAGDAKEPSVGLALAPGAVRNACRSGRNTRFLRRTRSSF